jgi:histidinol phosphatase-like PHP family hydrolase
MPPTGTPLTNGRLAVLLHAESDAEEGHRRRALRRAGRAAMMWPEEAATLMETGRPLTGLRNVGPWVAERIQRWFEEPPPDAGRPDETRRDFLTMAQVRSVLDRDPSWERDVLGDLQMHTIASDGSQSLPAMVESAIASGLSYVAITDHSKSLTIAHGMDEARLTAQGLEIDEINDRLRTAEPPFRVLKAIEMDVFSDGSGDMDGAALASLDLVLGAFHTRLRVAEDQTERYLAALRNPSIDVLAHPRARMFGRRAGIRAEWPRVFDEAFRLDKALEIDASPDRQDLNVELLRVVAETGVRISIGTDAHHSRELSYLPFGLAAAAIAGVPRDRILNYQPAGEVEAWVRGHR